MYHQHRSCCFLTSGSAVDGVWLGLFQTFQCFPPSAAHHTALFHSFNLNNNSSSSLTDLKLGDSFTFYVWNVSGGEVVLQACLHHWVDPNGNPSPISWVIAAELFICCCLSVSGGRWSSATISVIVQVKQLLRVNSETVCMVQWWVAGGTCATLK